jgi:hypothetical protein
VRLVARSARHAPDARERERHWDAAIGLLTGCATRARRRRGAGRTACGPSAWRGSRARPDRAGTRADGRREGPRCICSADAHLSRGAHETADTMSRAPAGPTPLAACAPRCARDETGRTGWPAAAGRGSPAASGPRTRAGTIPAAATPAPRGRRSRPSRRAGTVRLATRAPPTLRRPAGKPGRPADVAGT